MNNCRVYHAEDRLDFGKNEGLKLKEVYKFQPSYIEWAVMTKSDFKININSFNHLPPPTTIGYVRNSFDPKRLKKFRSQTLQQNLSQEMVGDTLNIYKEIGVEEIKNMILDDCTQGVKLENYKFPDWVVEMNNSK